VHSSAKEIGEGGFEYVAELDDLKTVRLKSEKTFGLVIAFLEVDQQTYSTNSNACYGSYG
jgi:hypothetical protein